MKQSILIFRDFYLPGYKSGGPVQSISNLVGQLGDEYDFKIVTTDRDEGDTEPYKSVEIDAWNKVGKAQVFYLSSRRNPITAMTQLLNQTPYDLMYLNSFFSPRYTILPLVLRRLGLIPRKPVVVAPRGEFSPWALSLKSRKKDTFIALAHATGLYKEALWQATDEKEADQIRQIFGASAEVLVAGMPLPSVEPMELPAKRVHKEAGRLEMGFLGRISTIKQVDFALEVLGQIRDGDVYYHIHGPAEDRAYFERCQRLADGLPSNIHVEFHGSLPHPQVRSTLDRYDLMFMPSKSESFGHAILESLLSWCPVLIGQSTPWRNLAEKSAGWDLPLDKPGAFADTLRRAIAMDAADFQVWHQGARDLAFAQVNADDTDQEYRQLFGRLL